MYVDIHKVIDMSQLYILDFFYGRQHSLMKTI